MVAETIRVLIVSSILGCVLVNGLPTGAPAAACATITPNHPGASASTTPVPFTVDLSSFPSRGYVPGQNYNIILQGSSSNPNFRGFFIQGRVRADESAVGTFGSGTHYQSRCSGNTAATHISRNDKTSVTLVWTAPPAGTGCICFRYAFVDLYTVFWANQITACISENLQTTIQASSSGTINGNDFTISVSANVAGEFECSLDGASFQSCSTGDVFPDLSVGSHTINVRFTPTGSCESFALRPPLNISIIQPTTPPTTGPIRVAINGSVSVSGNAATITLNNNFNGVFQCSLDGGSFANCQSGDIFTGLSAGSHTINVRFTPAGSSQILRLSFRFTVVMMTTVLPTPTPTEIQASGTATVTGNSVNVTLTSNFPGRFRCSLDGRRFRRCSTGTTFSGLSVGEHTIVIQFTPDGSSQSSTLEPSLTFTVSPPPTPTPEVTLNVRVTATGNKITVNYDVSETATCTCQLDSETPVTCNSGHMFNNVASGDHTVTVSCITTNLDTISRSVDISVSETQTFTVTGRQQVSGTNVQVFFNSTLPATFQCRLDSGPPVTCVSGHTYADLGLGRHRIQLIARLISNRQTRRILRLPRFTIQPPTTTSPPPPPPPRFTEADAQVFTNCSARLRFSADVPVTFRCRVNGGPWKPCSDGYLVSDLPPGTNEVEIEASTVQAPDVKTVVTATLNIRGQACSLLEIDCPVCNPSSIVGNNFTFTVNANKPNVEFLCSLNNRRPSPCNEGSVTYSNLRNRRNQLVTITASSCNGETTTKNITFSPKYNRRLCQVYTCGDGLVTTGSSARVTFLSDDPDATFRCKLDRQRRRSCESPLELSDLSSGSHRLDITPRCAINARGRRLRLSFSIP